MNAISILEPWKHRTVRFDHPSKRYDGKKATKEGKIEERKTRYAEIELLAVCWRACHFTSMPGSRNWPHGI